MSEPIRAALEELVTLKDIKDKLDGYVNGKYPDMEPHEWASLKQEYARRKPLAWEAARAALSGAPK